jgi:AAA ATPase containing von Willebrand factor type A (vWA) domain
MGLVDKIKQDVKKSGRNKGKFIYFREGQKQRIRFLTDMDDGMEVTFHDSFEAGINVPCQELFGKDCPYCDEEGLRTRSQYIWSVYNYETKEVQLFMYPVNNCSPIPALMAMYENYGTITDRDYVISVSGKQQNKTFSVVPMDKVKFRNAKVKPFSEQAILKMLDKAYPADADEDEDEDEDDKPVKKSKPSKSKPNTKKAKPEPEEDEDWEDEEEEIDYSEMSPKELYQLCKERDIDVAPKKPAKYYINQLEEYDAAQEDWEDDDFEDDEEEWEDG